MTDELDALLAAVHDNPQDVVPRLVYADWLDEHGEHEYAEFIRLSIRLAQREMTDPRVRKDERRRRHEFAQKLLRRWGLNEYAKGFWSVEQAVLADSGWVTATELIQGGPVWPPYFRPRRIIFLEYRGHESVVLASPLIGRARELVFRDPTIIPGENEETADDGILDWLSNFTGERLRVLRFDWGTVSYATLSRFAISPLVQRLDLFSFGISRRLYQYNDAGSELEIEIANPGGGRMTARLAEVAIEYPGFAPLP